MSLMKTDFEAGQILSLFGAPVHNPEMGRNHGDGHVHAEDCACAACAECADNGQTETVFAQVPENNGDALASVSTQYTMNVGDAFTGTITVGDADFVRITLTAGETYVFNLSGTSGGGGTLPDTYLTLMNASGNVITENDDGGPGFDSEITFTAATSGTYYLVAEAYSTETGSYTLSASETVPPPPSAQGTLDELANYLTNGYWGGSQRAYDTSSSNQITVNISALTAAGQQLARWAFEAWEMVANLDFVVVSGSANITFDDNESGAFATSSRSGTTILSSEVNVSSQWLVDYGTTIDSYSFSAYVHEIGHAIGLGHQGDYNGSATYGIDDTFSNDSYQVSVMSYFSQTQNTTVTASYGEPITAMLADVIAIQNLYGAPTASSATAGNTTWGANSNLGNYLSDYFASVAGTANSAINSDSPVAFTIYDRDGIDTVDLSFATTNNRIDLNDGMVSDVLGGVGNVGIARGTVIENYIGGSGSDNVTGNASNNTINGGAGNDVIDGGGGTDTIYGGNGFDRITTGNGNDTIYGGDDSNDLRDEVSAGGGNDFVDAGYGNDEVYGGSGNDTILGGFGADRLIGQTGDDIITGGPLSDLIFGGDGFDFINGGFGHDRLNGGDGGDSFYHLGINDHGSDWIQDYDYSEGDVLVFADGSASASDFQVNIAETANAGVSGVAEAFVIYIPTGQIIWALVDGGAQAEINIQIAGDVYNIA